MPLSKSTRPRGCSTTKTGTGTRTLPLPPSMKSARGPVSQPQVSASRRTDMSRRIARRPAA